MACASYYDSEVQAASAKYGVPPDIINAVIHQESGGNPNAYNPNDPSYGLMGVQYGTAKDMGYKGPAPSNPPKPTDPLMQPANNIDAGTAYLAYQYKRYGNWPDAISAYNGGHALKNPDGSYANASYVNSVLNCAGQYSTGGAGTGGTTTGGGGGATAQLLKDSIARLRMAEWRVLLVRDKVLKFIEEYIEEIEVNFYETGQCDDFSITLDNTGHRFTFTGKGDPNNPVFGDIDLLRPGDQVLIVLFYSDHEGQDFGLYTIDEIEDSDPPATVRISGLSADIVEDATRTERQISYSNPTLFGIVREVAKRHPEWHFPPLTEGKDVDLTTESKVYKEQASESDMAFLARLADHYGFFTNVKQLGQDPTATLYFREKNVADINPLFKTWAIDEVLERRFFRYQTWGAVQTTTATYYDPQTNQSNQATVKSDPTATIQRQLIRLRATDFQQALRIAQAKHNWANQWNSEGTFLCMGTPELRSPCNIVISNMGGLNNGVWHIQEAHHKDSKKRGYTVEMRGYKLSNVAPVTVTGDAIRLPQPATTQLSLSLRTAKVSIPK